MTGVAVDRDPAVVRPESTYAGVQAPPGGRSAFVPLALLGLALAVASGAALHLAWREHGALAAARLGQERAHENAHKMREALDRIASQTQHLADRGNPNARLIVDELRRRGITIRTSAAATDGTAPSP